MNEPFSGLWPASFEPFASMGLATAILVATVALATRLTRSARWQHLLWQAATLGMLGLFLAELLGLGTGLASLLAPLVAGEHPQVLTDRATVSIPRPSPMGRPDANRNSPPRPRIGLADANGERAPLRSLLGSPLPLDRSSGIRSRGGRYSMDKRRGQAHFSELSFRQGRAPIGRKMSQTPTGEQLRSGANADGGPPVTVNAVDTRAVAPPSPHTTTTAAAANRPAPGTATSLVTPDQPAMGSPLAGMPDRSARAVRSKGFAKAPVAPSAMAATAPTAATGRAVPPPRPTPSRTRQAGRWLDGAGLRVAWAVGSLLLALFFFAVRLLAWQWLHHRTARASERLVDRATEIARRHGLRKNIRVVQAAGIPSPLALGLLHPTVVLPSAFATDFSTGQQDAILAHELAHLAAGDPRWQLAADMVAAMMWWHPLVWYARHALRVANETAADEASLLIEDGPRHLAAGLVTLGQRLGRQPAAGWLSATGPGFRSGLGQRVERLLKLGPISTPPRRRSVSLIRLSVTLPLVGAMFFFTAWARPQVPLRKGETSMNLLKVSWNHSLAAALAATLVGPVVDGAVAENLAPATTATRPSPHLAQRGPRSETDHPDSTQQSEADRPNRPVKPDLDTDLGADAEEDSAFNLHQQRERILHQSRRLHHALEEKAHALVERLAAIGEKEPELAEALDRQIDKVRERLEQIEEKVRGVELEELQAHIDTMRRDLRQLMAAGEKGEARRVEREIDRAERERERMRRPGPPPKPGDRGPDEAEREGRLDHVREAIENLRAAGLDDQANRLERDFWQLEPQRLDRVRVRKAIENLRAAGLDNEAERLARDIEQAEHRLQEPFGAVLPRPDRDRRRGRTRADSDPFGGGRRAGRARPPRLPGRRGRLLERHDETFEPPHHGPLPPEGFEHKIDAMRAQIDAMRDAMQEMREQIGRLAKRVGEDEDEEDEDDGKADKDDR